MEGSKVTIMEGSEVIAREGQVVMMFNKTVDVIKADLDKEMYLVIYYKDRTRTHPTAGLTFTCEYLQKIK